MKILIISHFTYNLDGSNIERFLYLGEMLSELGHSVEMITSSFNHMTKEYHRDRIGDFKTKITLIDEPKYKSNVSVKRLFSHFVWGNRVAQYLDRLKEVPDIIYCALPSYTVGVNAARYAKKNHIKFIIDVQDLWPEAFYMVVKNTLFKHFLYPFKKFADNVYKYANSIIAVSETYLNRALEVNKHAENALCVFLGNDGYKFNNAKKEYAVKRNEHEFWLAYIGTLGYSYDIPCAIEAISIAQKLVGENLKLKFIVMGTGPLEDTYKSYAESKGISYEFTGALPYNRMVGLMCSCNVVLNPIVRGAAQSVTNKVGDYALSGLPVISTQENMEYRNIVSEYNCGINCECGNAVEMASAITRLALDPLLCEEMGKNAARLGRERFDRRYSYSKIVDIIERLGRCVD